jgi:hypothetical protein
MGFAFTKNPSQLVVNSPMQLNSEIHAIANDLPIYDITTPAYIGNLKHAYLDLYMTQVYDNSGALNYLESAGGFVYLQIFSGGSWRNAISIYNESFYVPASSYITGQIAYVGTTDIAAYLRPSTSYNQKIASAEAHADHLWIYGMYTQLRLYFE